MRKHERFLSTSFYLRNLEKNNNKYYALKSIIDEIGRIEAHKEDFSLLKRETMTSHASSEGGKSIVYKYTDKQGVKYLIHEVTDENNCVIHRDFDAVRIASGQLVNKKCGWYQGEIRLWKIELIEKVYLILISWLSNNTMFNIKVDD